jgi:hypothetical protein
VASRNYWRINWRAVDRLGERLGQLSNATMEVIDMALRTALDLQKPDHHGWCASPRLRGRGARDTPSASARP